jgi:hypothetical protein
LVVAIGLPALAGCGGDNLGKLVSVSGKVTLDGHPLPSVTVTFVPDASKGNKVKARCFAIADAEGHYSLQTTPDKSDRQRDGAPLGWYKVRVQPGMPTDMGAANTKLLDLKNLKNTADAGKSGATGSLVPDRYKNESTSPLSIEVVESPAAGAYDLNLKK